jgi:hypothetical protein
MVTPRQDIIEQMAQRGVPPADQPYVHADMAWNAVMRQLEQKDPSYRN